MATPRNPWLCQARRVGEARTPMALGRTPLPTAHDRLLAQVTSGGRSRRDAEGLKGLITHPLSNDRYARSHGKMTFPAATFRREKVRCDLFTRSSMPPPRERRLTAVLRASFGASNSP